MVVGIYDGEGGNVDIMWGVGVVLVDNKERKRIKMKCIMVVVVFVSSCIVVEWCWCCGLWFGILFLVFFFWYWLFWVFVFFLKYLEWNYIKIRFLGDGELKIKIKRLLKFVIGVCFFFCWFEEKKVMMGWYLMDWVVFVCLFVVWVWCVCFLGVK